MGIDVDLGMAFAKSQVAAGVALPVSGNAFISVKDADKKEIIPIARRLYELGFNLLSTRGTAQVLERVGLPVERINKIHEDRPHVLDFMKDEKIHLIINTPSGKRPRSDQLSIRSYAVYYNIPLITTLKAAQAVTYGIESLQSRGMEVKPIQEWYGHIIGLSRRPGVETAG
jgi:carbamoyl-phosphate synthase large subunit